MDNTESPRTTANPTAMCVTVVATEPFSRPSAEIVAKQDQAHSESDFLRDLGKVTRRLDEPAD
jgi:hypothetical protein